MLAIQYTTGCSMASVLSITGIAFSILQGEYDMYGKHAVIVCVCACVCVCARARAAHYKSTQVVLRTFLHQDPNH